MNPHTTLPVVLVTAVSLELDPLVRVLEAPAPVNFAGKTAFQAQIEGIPVVAIAGGMGKVNAAHALTALLARSGARAVINFGVAGAYVGAAAEQGGVALATREVYGDEGVETPAGWISTEEIGIPLVQLPDATYFNELPLDDSLVTSAAQRLDAHGIPSVRGPFVTVSSCSGTERRGRELMQRFGAICEGMEGAALAHVCILHELPFIEVRAVSNLVEDRDLTRWRLRDAAELAARAAYLLVPLFGETVRPNQDR